MKAKIAMILILVMASTMEGYAQTGINTRHPQGTLHVDGAGDNPLSAVPTASQVANDLLVSNIGWMGLGNIAPLLKLDLRSTADDDALGIGFTNMTAAAAGAGAIRYNPNSEPGDPNVTARIEVSDGVVWKPFYYIPPKAVVVARKSTSQTVPINTWTIVSGWDEVNDHTNNFDPTTGAFTAHRAGTYTFLFTYNFNAASVTAARYVDIHFIDAANNELGKAIKTIGQSQRNTQIGGSVVVTLNLPVGAQVRTRIWQNYTNSATLRTNANLVHPDAGFNNITVVEH